MEKAEAPDCPKTLKHPNAQGRLAEGLRDPLAPARLPPSSFLDFLRLHLLRQGFGGGGRAGHPRGGSSRERSRIAPRMVDTGWAGSSRA